MIISPLMSIPILCIGLYLNRDRLSNGYAVPFALIYGMIGYSLRPHYNIDLVRYYMQIEKLAGKKLSYIFSTDRQRLYVQDILFYFVSRTGNANILGFIVGFVCYLVIFYIFFDVIKYYQTTTDHNCNLHILMIGVVMVSIVSPMSVLSNVRCVSAYILISFAAYREWIQKKKNVTTLLLYIIPVGLHASAVIILMMRIAVPFLKRFTKIFISTALLLPILIEFIYEKISKISLNNIPFYYIMNAVGKAYRYLNWTEGGWADQVENSLSNKITRIYGTFFLIIMIIFYFTNKKNVKNTEHKRMHDYLFVCSVVALGTLNIKVGAFWRFEALVVFFSPIILMPIVVYEIKKYKYLLVVLYLSACLMGIANIIRFTRAIRMREFFTACINTSTIKIVGELLRGVTVILGV